jgi:hypothetical protein
MSQYRGSVAVVIAFTLGVVLIVIVVAAALGVRVSELTKDAAIAAVGAMAGGLVAYLSGRGSS